ncbi:copper homeostasis protein [Bifidobacterium xylocopae]|uniref:PF03932 family protein CutC n=1 Tax=Bifidobacterium xylocopae TaxID=2493119 RepID=A0A366KBS4_9BIFI|nr:copper homeostasis protein [Bifidobacterium xylocopae]
MRLEIAVQDLAGAAIARQAGADRVELCVALGATGGLTPSLGLVKQCAGAGLPLGVQVLVRPRGGDFIYNEEERVLQLEDARLAIRAGAAGIVTGGLDRQGGLDEGFMARMAQLVRTESSAEGRRVDLTCHRAFDVVGDRSAALETLIDLGYDRVLTSGGASAVPRGLDQLDALTRQAAGRIQIMAGGGLKPAGIKDAVAAGVDAVHMSARRMVASSGGPGGGGDEAQVERTDPGQVRAAVAALAAALALG